MAPVVVAKASKARSHFTGTQEEVSLEGRSMQEYSRSTGGIVTTYSLSR
ncbi:MAG: hypothetical protein M3O97_03810 [Thermoproteota archaeon]|nr:hypothetical protein [Thermoproteota archaeon]